MATQPLRVLLQGKNLLLSDLARLIKADPATITRWSQYRVPAERVIDVERLTGIPRERLRPDLYPSRRRKAVGE